MPVILGVMLKEKIILNFIVFVLLLFILAFSLIKSMLDVSSYEKKRYERFRKKGVYSEIKEAGGIFFIVALCFLVAGYNATFEWVWRILACIFFLISMICFIASLVNKFSKFDSHETPDLTESILNKNIAKRKMKWIAQIIFILFWLYSWKTLFA